MELFLFFILLVVSAFFASSESSLFSLETIHKNDLKDNFTGKKRTLWIFSWLNEPEKTLSTILFGNLMVNILISDVGYGIIASYSNLSHIQTGIISTIVIAIVLLTFSEILPKAMALRIPVRWSMAVAPFLKSWFSIANYICQPIYLFTNYITSKLPKQQTSYTEKELLNAILLASSYNIIKDYEERTLKRSVLFYYDTVFQAIIPRSEVFMIPHNLSVLKIKKLFLKDKKDTVVVYHDHTEKLLGFLHIRNLVLLSHKKLKSIMNKVQPILFLPETIPLGQALQKLIKEKTEVAAVVDESGEFSGILTLKNLLERLTGKWENELSNGNYTHRAIKKVDEKVFRVQGSITLVEFNEFFNASLSHGEIETVAGYLIYVLDGFPKTSTSFKLGHLYFYDMKTKNHKLESFLVRILYGN